MESPDIKDIIDITVPIREDMPIFPGDPRVYLDRVTSMDTGDDANLTRMSIGLHTGTHIDAPLHVLSDGGGVETIPLDVLIGPCAVIDATSITDSLNSADIQRLVPPDAVRVLFKTRNSDLWAESDYSSASIDISTDAARALATRGVQLVGIDYLSIGSIATHRTLLAVGIVCVEGLDLRNVEPDPSFDLICLPMLIPGVDGAPARVVLRGHPQ